MAEHRVLLVELAEACTQRGRIYVQRLSQLVDLQVAVRQELVQRRIEQADRHGQARHDLEQPDEVLPLHRQDLPKCRAPAFLVLRHDHLAHGHDPVRLEEHVLGAAEADALRTEFARLLGVGRRVGIGADLHAAKAVRPLHERAEIAGQLRLEHLHRALDDAAVGAVDGDDLAFLERHAARGKRALLKVDADRAGARDARPAHAARNHGRVARHAAASGQDAGSRVHAVDVLGARLVAHENDRMALVPEPLGVVRREDDLAASGTRRGGKPLRDDFELGRGVDGRVQELVELRRLDAEHGLLFGDQPFARHVDRNLQRRGCGALAVAALEHPELAFLDGELHVLHVAVMVLQRVADAFELREGFRHDRFERRLVAAAFDARLLGDGLRRPDACHHVLALRVHQELAIEPLVARRRVAGESDAGRAGLAAVAEHHGLHVDRGAPAFGQIVELPVFDGARIVPAIEDRADRAPELLVDVLREGVAELPLHHLLIARDDGLPVLGAKVGVEVVAVLVLVVVEDFLEVVMLYVEHHAGIHLDEAPVAIEGEAAVAGARREAFHRLVVEAEIEDRVHHAGHRCAAARADRHKERVLRVAQHGPDRFADLDHGRLHIGMQRLGQLLAVRVIIGANLGGDREAWRHRQAKVRHLGEVRTFAAEQVLHIGRALCLARAEPVDVFGCAHACAILLFRACNFLLYNAL